MKAVRSMIFAIAGCLILATSLVAQSVPSAISYQGKLTDASGVPVPDGSYDITISLHDWQAIALWSSPPTTVEVKNGLFTTSFSPPASYFDNGNLQLMTTVGATPLSPMAKLLSVPFAIRASSADTAKTVPNGSISAVKLAADVVFTRAPFKSGVTSGLLQGPYSVEIRINNVVAPNATLAKPYREEIEVGSRGGITHWRLSSLYPVRLTVGSLTLRRKRTQDRDWYEWARTIAYQGMSTRDVEIRLYGDGMEKVKWVFSDAWPSGYHLRLADDGLPVEEITLESSTPVMKTHNGESLYLPIGSGTQVGFSSGQAAGVTYDFETNGEQYPGAVPASDVGFSIPVVQSPTGVKQPGPMGSTDRLVLRQQAHANPRLYDQWVRVRVSGSTSEYFRLTLPGSAYPPLMIGSNCWPCSYTLKLADDGLPIEEFEIAYDTPELP